MPDTLKRFTYKGYVDGDYVEDPEGEWMDADEVRAHIDALTAAAKSYKTEHPCFEAKCESRIILAAILRGES